MMTLWPLCDLLSQDEHLVDLIAIYSSDQPILGQLAGSGQHIQPVQRGVDQADVHGTKPVALKKQRQAVQPAQNVSRL